MLGGLINFVDTRVLGTFYSENIFGMSAVLAQKMLFFRVLA